MNRIYDPPNASLESSDLRPGEEIKQTILIRNWDVISTVFYTSLRNKFMWAFSIFCVGIWHAIGYVGLWALGFPVQETAQHTLSFFLWTIFVFAFSSILGASTLLLNPKWRQGRIGEHTITVTDTHIIEETEFNKTQVSWDSVDKLTKGRSSIFITYSGTEVFPFPSRCFQSKAAWDNFYAILREKFESNRRA